MISGFTETALHFRKDATEDIELVLVETGPVEEPLQAPHEQPGIIRVEKADFDQHLLKVPV